MYDNIDSILDALTTEQLIQIAGDDANSSTVSIHDSTINIYNDSKLRYNSPTPPSTPCPDCGEVACVCDIEETSEVTEWYAYPIYLYPFLAVAGIFKGIFLLGKAILGIKKPQQISALHDNSSSEIIDTDNIKTVALDEKSLNTKMSQQEIESQMDAWMERATEEELEATSSMEILLSNPENAKFRRVS